MSSDGGTIQNDEELPFNMNHVPEFFQRKCEAELNETFERKKQSLQDLKSLLANDKLTKDICFHEDLLVQYLRHSKYNTDKTYKHLLNSINFRNKEAKLFERFSNEAFIVSSTKFFGVLPKRSPDGSTIMVAQLGKWNTKDLPLDDLKRIAVIVFQQMLRDPMTQINGLKVIYDFAGFGLEHLKYITPPNVYFLYYVAICCIPLRYKEFHLLNPNAGLKLLWSIVKRFLSEKIKSRVFFHSDTKELLNFFPKSILPVQYGGYIQDINEINFVQRANSEHKKYTAGGQPNFY